MNEELNGNFVDDCSAAQRQLREIALDLEQLALAFQITGNDKMDETLLRIARRVKDVNDSVGSICENRVNKELREAQNANAHLFGTILEIYSGNR